MTELLDYFTPRIKEDADCWIWQLGCTSGGTPTMHPTGDKQIAVRRWMALQLGKKINLHHVATTTCGNSKCVAPDHLLIASRSKLGKLIDARTGFTRTPQRRKKISDSKRATAKLNPDAVRSIRAAKSSLQAAQEYGIAKATAIRIRAYESWRDYSSPFAGLMG